MLQALDLLLTITHLVVILFNMTGWIFPATRKIHFWVVVTTLASWGILGIWYGFGYCFLTDWQWSVKAKLGETGLPNSFIKYFADDITGKDFDAAMVDSVTAIVFLAIILITAVIRIRDLRKKT